MVKIKFRINDNSYEIPAGMVGPEMSLNDYIRNVAELRGTKVMCQEGGCGACIVAARIPIPPGNNYKTFAVNSCLVSVLSCYDWEITTVEGIGNRINGYHEIQTRLASFNGTQCGYCTPGWVMNMYCLQANNKKMKMEEIENSFAGNMCRCTGYRPIADAFKSFAKDINKTLLSKLVDLEDFNMVKPCGIGCSKKCTHRDRCFNDRQIEGGNKIIKTEEESDAFTIVNDDRMMMIRADMHIWYRVSNLTDAFKAMSQGNYKLIAGNTGQGVYPVTEYPPIVIDIFNVVELKGYILDVNLVLGAGMPLSEMMELFLNLSRQREEFSYLNDFYDHMDLVAHISVRNIGTIGGNLYLKYCNKSFPSDLFLLFETIGAMITIVDGTNGVNTIKLPEFLRIDMKDKIIKNILLPPVPISFSIKTYKIMPRSQNAHAIVNAGFFFLFKKNSNVVKKATIVYSGISPSFIHATNTEEVLKDQDLYSESTLQLALRTLYEEVNPVEALPEPSAAYRKMLAVTLYYKAILSLCPENKMNSKYKSGAETIKRSTSHGTQTFDTDKSVWPLNQPVPKLEALVQCSGETTFANDLPAQSNEVFAAFVTADTVPGSMIKDFNTTEAFKIPGVIAFYSATDIPGDNTFISKNNPLYKENEEILCKNRVKFYGQPAGIIVADREKTANKAAKMVKIKYSSVSENRPLLTISQVLKSPERSKRVRVDQTIEPSDLGNDVKTVVKGNIKIGDQYHYYMELQTCVTKPTEDGMKAYSSTQWPDLTNIAIAQCLNVPVNSINVFVRRIGGGYGGKISRSVQIACAAALVTHLLGKQCRMILPLRTNMQSIGKRFPTLSNFEIGANSQGQIQYLKNTFYEDAGCSYNECETPTTIIHFRNCYDSKRWYIQSNSVLTDKCSNVSCRAPFSAEGIAMIEYMMEKLAFMLGKDPVEVRLQNIKKENNPIPKMIAKLQKDASFDERKKEVEEFNINNRWRKRGIKLIPMTVDIFLMGNYNAIVSIFHGDGSVIITHGGIEMGQGINTKAAQVCAHILEIPLEKVSVKPTTSFTSPNAIITGGSISSECVAFAVMKACNILNKRLEPIRERMGEPSWKDLIDEAYTAEIDLQASWMFSAANDEVKPYDVYAVAILEVEVDILTGNHDVRRVDILEDVGRSLSPEIDVGQIEGAFVMGLGYWTSEKLIYDGDTGKLLTDRTWTYKIPGIKDIPADMRIYFKRGARNKFGILQSKATGEPAFCLATIFIHAVREAVRSARKDAGYEDVWFDMADGTFGPDVSLNEYIRDVADLRGTKSMCLEGGCGICIVAVRAALPPTNEVKLFSVNSCLVSVLSCHGWEITTVEGVGNRLNSYHEIQSRLAKFNGTQCGYCTPGWIMNMYSLYGTKKNSLTQRQIENSFASNLCRCTGYRAIADAFKTFAENTDEDLNKKLIDLEDLSALKSCKKQCLKSCDHQMETLREVNVTDDQNWCVIEKSDKTMIIVDSGKRKWYKLFTLDDVFKIIAKSDDYKLIAGNTGQGVYHIQDYPQNVIDIFNVVELKGHSFDVNLILGAGMPLSEMMDLFNQVSSQDENFSYLKILYDHMDLVAHIPVRNIGTIGGNLFMKYENNDFQSDLFLLFETVGGMVTIAESISELKTISFSDFLKADMKRKLIINVMLPPLSSENNKIKTYKIMPRSQNAHAVVNAGFLFKFKQNSKILEKATIVFGSISPKFIHATKTEEALAGKDIFTDETLQLAIKTLSEEVMPEEAPPEPSAAYRKMLATALYYKAILSLCPDGQISSRYKTGGEVLKRNTSRGAQIFDTDKTVWPLNQPIPKLEALVQCSGEATFSNDLPKQPNEVFAAFVTADVRPGSIISGFDTTEAFKINGVVAFYSAKDIPGNNSFTPLDVPLVSVNEEILCSKVVKFYGDPVGIIVATRQKTANKAAKLVKVNYESISENKPLLTIDDVLNSPERNKRVVNNKTVQPEEIGKDVKHVISGELKLESQSHFYMEPQTCVVRPTEDGLEVSSSTQWLDLTNMAVANCLNVPVNSINVVVRRVGGGYGGKITRSCQIACSAALVTHLLGRTCRFILPLQTGMKMIGKRLPTNCNFQVGVNNDGEVQYLKNIFYQDNGCGVNEVVTAITVNHVFNGYDTKRWYIEGNSLTTDTASNTWCRAPASTEGLAMTEYIMEKIAYKIGKDPFAVRLANMTKTDNPIPDLIQQLMKDSNYEERIKEVKKFNDENRWRKRALKVLPMTYELFYIGPFNSLISVYHADGSVVITHGGVEMGQGINTKTAQVCAYKFGIPIEKISVKPSSSFTSPNMMATGGSVGSECIAFATMKACEIILERLAPIRETMKDPTWEDLVKKAFQAGIDLQASYMYSTKDDVKPYDIYGVCALEVEIDILTGNHDIRRVDLLEDTGRSLNPMIDVSQIEGAFVMGIGYWTSEKIIYDPDNGKLLTDRTWNYKPPGIKDIPADFRIYFRRNSKNPCGVLQSKATGEPALCLAVVLTHALREAVRAARLDAGYEDEWVDIQNPCTVENIFMAVGHKLEHFTLK